MQLVNFLKTITLISLVTFLSACPGGGSDPQGTTLDISVALPSSFTGINNIKVYVQKDSEGQNEMVYDSGLLTASYTFTGLESGISQSSSTYSITVEYLSTSAIEVATASKSLLLADGSNTLDFLTSEFDTDIDTDGDTKFNINELISGSNPLIPTCVLNSTGPSGQIGQCELGS